MFLDDTACNLASVNLLPYRNADCTFDVAGFEHTCRLWTLVLEISVMMAQFPSRAIAERSYEYRTLGLGYANIGGLLMTSGIPYDSAEGRAIAGAITAVMTGVAYATSAEMAKELGAVRRLQAQRQAHAPRHPQPPQRRPRQRDGLRRPQHQPGAARPRLADRTPRSSSAPRPPGTRPWPSAKSTATATPRSR